jgi:hypothetical protein
MKIKRMLILVLALFFLFGATLYIPNGSVMKWGVESVYAKNHNNHHGNGHGHGHGNGHGRNKVPEPSSLILLGIGLAAVGGYTALKSKKNKENK